MQIFIVILLMLGLLAFIIYKINSEFGKKEILLFIGSIVVAILAYTMYERNDSQALPNAFKTKYKSTYNVEILKLQSELLNNKNISSKTKFIYKFTYIINKENKEYLCVLNNVVIKKIENALVFEDFYNLKESCQEK